MTVRELIKRLIHMPMDTEVNVWMISNDSVSVTIKDVEKVDSTVWLNCE